MLAFDPRTEDVLVIGVLTEGVLSENSVETGMLTLIPQPLHTAPAAMRKLNWSCHTALPSDLKHLSIKGASQCASFANCSTSAPTICNLHGPGWHHSYDPSACVVRHLLLGGTVIRAR